MSDWIEILRHTIGADKYGHTRHDRNYFITGDGSTDWQACVDMVSAGYMTSRKGNAIIGGDDIFYATESGREFVKINNETAPVPPKRTKYDEFLDADGCAGDSFGEFLCGVRLPEFESRQDLRRDERYGVRTIMEYRMYRRYDYWTRDIQGGWCATKKEAKASYKAALKARAIRLKEAA
jgi:hypothetical protein